MIPPGFFSAESAVQRASSFPVQKLFGFRMHFHLHRAFSHLTFPVMRACFFFLLVRTALAQHSFILDFSRFISCNGPFFKVRSVLGAILADSRTVFGLSLTECILPVLQIQ